MAVGRTNHELVGVERGISGRLLSNYQVTRREKEETSAIVAAGAETRGDSVDNGVL
jgi:hypothetical protein